MRPTSHRHPDAGWRLFDLSQAHPAARGILPTGAVRCRLLCAGAPVPPKERSPSRGRGSRAGEGAVLVGRSTIAAVSPPSSYTITRALPASSSKRPRTTGRLPPYAFRHARRLGVPSQRRPRGTAEVAERSNVLIYPIRCRALAPPAVTWSTDQLLARSPSRRRRGPAVSGRSHRQTSRRKSAAWHLSDRSAGFRAGFFGFGAPESAGADRQYAKQPAPCRPVLVHPTSEAPSGRTE